MFITCLSRCCTVNCYSTTYIFTAGPPVVPSHQKARVDAHMYDVVSAEPQYAQVNKNRKQNEDGIHYAEIQVLQSETVTSRGKLKQTSNYDNTEYATIDFKSTVKTPTSAEPADLFIPPGELQRPNKSFSHRKNVHSKRAVMA
ncbi:hypothetical protein cypCar_00012532 [Cyprinus carpio]|uniref:Zgc:193711 n=1 Tax=Cyprinus carpio TaxID=7962 RepID=A0A8C1D973_CYPCA|nr:hypothetical protein cypCar_00012532 [Cyprinus carpio]